MKRVIYAGGSFLTDDAAAAALTSYAADLARAGSADTVSVPGLTDRGEAQRIEVLLGPASQIMIEDADDVGDVDSAGFVSELGQRSTDLRPPLGGGGPATYFDPL